MNRNTILILSILFLAGCASNAIPIKEQSLVLNLASVEIINSATKIQRHVSAFARVSKTKPCVVWIWPLRSPTDWRWLKVMYEELRHCDGWRHDGDDEG